MKYYLTDRDAYFRETPEKVSKYHYCIGNLECHSKICLDIFGNANVLSQ